MNAIKLANERKQQKDTVVPENKQNGEATLVKSTPKPSNETGSGDKQADDKSVSSNETTQPSETESEDLITVQEKSLLQKIVRTKLINSKYELEVKRKDPSSPLYSVKSFEALHL